ncbi:MAG: HupE/UreJ family protein [Woeseiaceae bacterium]|nr:HupE/UreJ family protein [Woeseiaceae bacterium]
MTRYAWLCVLLLFGGISSAHEVRPAFLRISDASAVAGPDSFDVLWRVPTGGEMELTIYVVMPGHCSARNEPLAWIDAGVRAAKWTSHCPGGIQGHEIAIGDLTASVTDVLVRYERSNGTAQVERLTPTSPSFIVTESETWLQVARTYTGLGVEHIMLGIDHLLFVLALLMIVAGWRVLVATVTSFTVAHSITLAAATLGLVHVPQAPVEAVIALSILFVAMEIVHWRQGNPGLTRQYPWIVAFVFGLLHGFGFAGALSDIGLPEHAIPLALLFFNVGVELGQLLFIAAVLLTWWIFRKIPWPSWAWRVPVYGIGSMAAYWTIDRVAGFAVS